MKVVVVEPMKRAYVKDIDSGLESLQKEVDGYIEAIYPFEDEVAIVCNEEGKLNHLDPNRGLFDEEGNLYDIIQGTFLVVGLTEDNFGSLSEELAKKYLRKYRHPEIFMKVAPGKIVALRV